MVCEGEIRGLGYCSKCVAVCISVNNLVWFMFYLFIEWMQH